MQVVIHDMNREEFQRIYEKLKVEAIEKKRKVEIVLKIMKKK